MKAKFNKYHLWGSICILLAVVILFWPTLEAQVDNPDFSITYLDVGQGDSIFIACGDENILIDGGGSPTNVTGAGERIVVPFLKSLGITKLDLVINTHPDADHIGGLLPVLDQMPVDKLAMFPNYEKVNLKNKLETLAKNKKVAIDYVSGGQIYDFASGLQIAVIAPTSKEYFSDDKLNEGSLVLHISFGDFDILTTGDLEGAEEKAVLAKLAANKTVEPPIDVDRDGVLEFADFEVVQMPHHGSKYSYDENWYDAFCPEAVIISVGANNMYGHPYSEVTKYWQNKGAKVYRTDLDGAVTMSVKNNQLFYNTTLN